MPHHPLTFWPWPDGVYVDGKGDLELYEKTRSALIQAEAQALVQKERDVLEATVQQAMEGTGPRKVRPRARL